MEGVHAETAILTRQKHPGQGWGLLHSRGTADAR